MGPLGDADECPDSQPFIWTFRRSLTSATPYSNRAEYVTAYGGYFVATPTDLDRAAAL
jgi:hypothetical protein